MSASMPSKPAPAPAPWTVPLVDSHCHLDFPDYQDKVDAVLASMRERGVSHALCVSVNLAGFPRVLDIARGHDNLYASVGVHPDQLPGEPGTDCSVEALVDSAADPKVVAVGETGLDYHWVKDDPEWQRERFRTHIRASRTCRKPLIIHTREASVDTVRLMREENAGEAGGVMHCFTETWDVAKAALDLGFHISFSGIVTFKNAADLRDVARRVPDDRLLVETDSPFLAPVPVRGKVNEPSNVRYVADLLASLRGVSTDELARQTTRNFRKLFLERT
jgi:TatD DNase family protein